MKIGNNSQFDLGLQLTVRGTDGRVRAAYQKYQPVASLYKRVVVKDPDGVVKSDSGDQVAHSFTFQFTRLLEYFMRGVNQSSLQCRDTSNTLRTLDMHTSGYGGGDKTWYCFWMNAGEDDDSFGILLGTNDAAETNMDYRLGAQIAHGNGAGQLEHSPMSFVYPRVVGANVDLILVRSFYNNSGAPVTAYEFGVYAKQQKAGTGLLPYCVIRDTDSLGKTVEHGDTMTVQYTLRTGVGFTMRWWQLLKEWFACVYHIGQGHTGLETLMDVAGVNKSTAMYYFDYYSTPCTQQLSLQMNAGDNEGDYGIVLGTGTDAEALTDYRLQSKIPHGAGAGQLDYNATTFITAEEVGGNVDLILSRSFFNATESPIIVTEVGWYPLVITRNYGYEDGEEHVYCVVRDSLGVGVTVNPGDSATVQYTLRSNIGV